MIPMVDLKAQYLQLKDEIDQSLSQVLDSCAFVLGPNVKAFEEEAAAYLGVKHATGVASGTDALHLALLAAGVGEGDEVITTPFTFIATAEANQHVGAKPVFVDIDPKPSTSVPRLSKQRSRKTPLQSCRCICSASRRICRGLPQSAKSMGSRSLKTAQSSARSRTADRQLWRERRIQLFPAESRLLWRWRLGYHQ